MQHCSVDQWLHTGLLHPLCIHSHPSDHTWGVSETCQNLTMDSQQKSGLEGQVNELLRMNAQWWPGNYFWDSCAINAVSYAPVQITTFGWFSSMEMSHNFLYNIHVARVRWKNFILHLRMHARMGVQSYISPYLTHFLWICHLCWDFQPSMTCLYWGTSSGSKPTRTSMLNLKACGKG